MSQLIYMATDWNVPVITPVASSYEFLNKTNFPVLTRIGIHDGESLQDVVLKMFDKYDWRTVGIIYSVSKQRVLLLYFLKGITICWL